MSVAPDKFPEHKHAVDLFLATSPKPGDLLSHDQLDKWLGIDTSGVTSYEQAQDVQFIRLARVEAFKNELLYEHQIYLENVRGEGYRVVPPKDQSSAAEELTRRNVAQAIAKGISVAKNVDAESLTDAQRRENADAIARLASLRLLTRRAFRIDGPTTKTLTNSE